MLDYMEHRLTYTTHLLRIYISAQMNCYFSILIFIFGCIGNILNICVLCQKRLRSNSCSILLIDSSMFSLILLLSGLTPRVLSAWVVDLSGTVRIICKIRSFTLSIIENFISNFVLLLLKIKVN